MNMLTMSLESRQPSKITKLSVHPRSQSRGCVGSLLRPISISSFSCDCKTWKQEARHSLGFASRQEGSSGLLGIKRAGQAYLPNPTQSGGRTNRILMFLMCTELRAQRKTGKCSTIQLNALPQPMNSEEINWEVGCRKRLRTQPESRSFCLFKAAVSRALKVPLCNIKKQNRPKITNGKRLYCKAHYTEKLHKPNLFCMHACVSMCRHPHVCRCACTHTCMQMPQANSRPSVCLDLLPLCLLREGLLLNPLLTSSG